MTSLFTTPPSPHAFPKFFQEKVWLLIIKLIYSFTESALNYINNVYQWCKPVAKIMFKGPWPSKSSFVLSVCCRIRATCWFLPHQKILLLVKVIACQSWARACESKCHYTYSTGTRAIFNWFSWKIIRLQGFLSKCLETLQACSRHQLGNVSTRLLI